MHRAREFSLTHLCNLVAVSVPPKTRSAHQPRPPRLPRRPWRCTATSVPPMPQSLVATLAPTERQEWKDPPRGTEALPRKCAAACLPSSQSSKSQRGEQIWVGGFRLRHVRIQFERNRHLEYPISVHQSVYFHYLPVKTVTICVPVHAPGQEKPANSSAGPNARSGGRSRHSEWGMRARDTTARVVCTRRDDPGGEASPLGPC